MDRVGRVGCAPASLRRVGTKRRVAGLGLDADWSGPGWALALSARPATPVRAAGSRRQPPDSQTSRRGLDVWTERERKEERKGGGPRAQQRAVPG